MHIWLVNIFEGMPLGRYVGWRMGCLAQALVDAGHQVTWWTSDWDHVSKQKRSELSAGEYPWPVIALPTRPYFKNTSVQRFKSHMHYARDWKVRARAGIQTGELAVPDVVFVNSPPPVVAAAVAQLKQDYSFCMVCDIRDAWPETFAQLIPKATSLPKGLLRLLLRPFAGATKVAYQHADALCAVSQDYLELAKGYYSGAAKEAAVFYIGCKASQLNREPPEYPARDQRVLKLIYIGSQSSSYDLRTLIKALTHPSLSGEPIELHFAGQGTAIPQLKALAEKYNLGSIVTFHGQLELSELKDLLELCHLGVNAVKETSYIAMPNKIGDYCAAGLPVLHSRCEGELATLIGEKNIGRCYRSGSVGACAQAIRECLDDREGLALQSRNARAFAKASLDRTQIYPSMVRWLEELHSGWGKT